MKPTVGRIVHYMAYGSPCGTYPSRERAAIIAEVNSFKPGEGPDGLTAEEGAFEVKLAVLNPQGIHFNTSKYSVAKEAGTWSWPARE